MVYHDWPVSSNFVYAADGINIIYSTIHVIYTGDLKKNYERLEFS